MSEEKPKAEHKGPSNQNWLGWIVVGLSIVTMLTVYHSASCQAKYNRQSNEISSLRADYADADRVALKKLIGTISTATTPEQSRKALDAYNKAIAKTDKKRAENPIPAPPDACGVL